MKDPLNPVTKQDVEQVDQQLGDLITDMHAGKQNVGLLFSIGQQLSTLSENDQVPLAIKQKLHGALQDLQKKPFDDLDITQVQSAKQQVDDALDSL